MTASPSDLRAIPLFQSITDAHLAELIKAFQIGFGNRTPLASVVSVKYYDENDVQQTLATTVYGVVTSAEFVLYPEYEAKRTLCLEFFGPDMDEASNVIR